MKLNQIYFEFSIIILKRSDQFMSHKKDQSDCQMIPEQKQESEDSFKLVINSGQKDMLESISIPFTVFLTVMEPEACEDQSSIGVNSQANESAQTQNQPSLQIKNPLKIKSEVGKRSAMLKKEEEEYRCEASSEEEFEHHRSTARQNILPRIKTLIKKYLNDKGVKVKDKSQTINDFFTKKSSSGQEFSAIFNHPELRPYLEEMFRQRYLKRELLISNVKSLQAKIFYIEKSESLRKYFMKKSMKKVA